MLAHDEAREDAEDDADGAHNNTQKRNLVLTVRAAEDHGHSATSERRQR